MGTGRIFKFPDKTEDNITAELEFYTQLNYPSR